MEKADELMTLGEEKKYLARAARFDLDIIQTAVGLAVGLAVLGSTVLAEVSAGVMVVAGGIWWVREARLKKVGQEMLGLALKLFEGGQES